MSALGQLYEDIRRCQRCDIARTRTMVVPGEGAENAGILFIGEAPGWHEDQQGRPFVGAAGQFLEQLLTSIKLRRDQVYIANVIKCRPPNNRDPLPTEIQNCSQFLDRQVQAIHPRMIVTLGRYSMAKFFPGKSISRIHGTAQQVGDIVCFAMYHPAAALHQQSLRRTIEEDMLKIPAVLARAIPAVSGPKPQAQQLSMFET